MIWAARDTAMHTGVGFTAVVLAADRLASDPVAQAAGACCKALSPVGGMPMVLRVLDALGASEQIGSRILCGPEWSAIEQSAELRAGINSKQFGWVPNQATPSLSAYAAMQSLPETSPVLLTTADHALLSTSIIDYFCNEARASGCDLVAGVVPYPLLSGAYPEARRTVIKLRDNGYCGCNLFAFLTPHSRSAANFWRQVESQRKKPWRVVGVLGWTAVLRYLLGRLSLEEALERISIRMGLRVGAVIVPFAEAAVDVDSVSDWKLAQGIVNKALTI